MYCTWPFTDSFQNPGAEDMSWPSLVFELKTKKCVCTEQTSVEYVSQETVAQHPRSPLGALSSWQEVLGTWISVVAFSSLLFTLLPSKLYIWILLVFELCINRITLYIFFSVLFSFQHSSWDSASDDCMWLQFCHCLCCMITCPSLLEHSSLLLSTVGGQLCHFQCLAIVDGIQHRVSEPLLTPERGTE